MDKWIEYDPETGMRETNYFDTLSGRLAVTKEQDVEPLVEAAKAIANSGATDIGIKKGLWHYASIPLSVQYKLLMEYGLNLHDRNHWPRIFDTINRDFPRLKTTRKTHRMKGGGQVFAANSAKPTSLSTPANSTARGRLLIAS